MMKRTIWIAVFVIVGLIIGIAICSLILLPWDYLEDHGIIPKGL